MKEALEHLITQIKNSEEYTRYSKEKERVKQHPWLKSRLDEFRRINFELQNTIDEAEQFDKMQEFELEYEEFQRDPMVSAFLEAENDLCRMIQTVNYEIIDALDFE